MMTRNPVHRTMLFAAIAAACVISPARADIGQPLAGGALRAAVAEQPGAIAIHFDGPEGRLTAVTSRNGARASRTMTADTPLRIASNTKTFVAATVLRLWEKDRIELDAPIGPLLTPSIDAILVRDGYDTRSITVRHLLSHSAGLYDHGSDQRFVALLADGRGRSFTREQLVQLCADYADPQSRPGTEFRYSDTGYILLGDIVARLTGKTLARAVRDELGLNRLGLRSWWEVFERPPRRAQPRARQFLKGTDVTDVDPSLDLYGGGGLVASARDLAVFFSALFGGRVFDQPETLREMLWRGPHSGADNYRLGIFVSRTAGGELYWHSGFWGTYAAWSPTTRTAVGAVADEQGGLRPLMPAIEAVVTGSDLSVRGPTRGVRAVYDQSAS